MSGFLSFVCASVFCGGRVTIGGMRKPLINVAGAFALLAASVAAGGEKDAVSFDDDVLPLFKTGASNAMGRSNARAS